MIVRKNKAGDFPKMELQVNTHWYAKALLEKQITYSKIGFLMP